MDLLDEVRTGLQLYSEALDEQVQQSETSLALQGPLFDQVEPWIREVQRQMIQRIPADTHRGKARAHSQVVEGWFTCPWSFSEMAGWECVVRNGKMPRELAVLKSRENDHPAIVWFRGPDPHSKVSDPTNGRQWVKINTNWVG
jgi:hypothetical protein